MSSLLPSFASAPSCVAPVSSTSAQPSKSTSAPLLRREIRRDGLTRVQQRVMVIGVLGVHLAAVWGLLQVREVREAVLTAAPMFVDLIAPPAPAKPPAPPPQPRPQPPPPLTPARALPKKAQPPAPSIVAAPSPAPAEFAAAPAPPEPAVVTPMPTAAVTPASAPAPATPPPPPKVIPASAVQYLEPPAPDYPRLSRRNSEAGKVLVRVYIDSNGQPHNVQEVASSGFARLDSAAAEAVQRARFRPYAENGEAIGVWTSIPINFEL